MKPKTIEQKAALKKHYLKKIADVGYRFECDKERQDAFEETDRNRNGMLDLAEYKNFCKKSCENISRRINVTLDTISEEQMETQFNANRFEGKEGLTYEDFRTKAIYDMRLSKFKAAIDELEGREFK